MQFLIFEEEKFYASCTLKDKNLAPKQNEKRLPYDTTQSQDTSIYAGYK